MNAPEKLDQATYILTAEQSSSLLLFAAENMKEHWKKWKSTVSFTILVYVDMRMRNIFSQLSEEGRDVNYLARILSLSGSTAGWNSDKNLPQWHFLLGWQFDCESS